MEYEVDSNQNLINWNAKGDERILQNINNILNTLKYEVPYDRLKGRDPDNLDKNFSQSRQKLIEETYDLINTYEPRATVKNVQCNYGKNEAGEDTPVIKVVVNIDS